MLSTEEQTMVPKGWGYELWIVNNDKFCGKLLKFDAGKRCSWHFHKIKEEAFFLHSGKMDVYYSYSDDFAKAEKVTLLQGDSFHVPVGLRHQMVALEESSLYEFSTQHFEADSYRIIKGD